MAFLGLKAWEYSSQYREGLLPHLSPATSFATLVGELFMNLYLVSTSLHALHLAIGIVLLAGPAAQVWRDAVRLPGRAITVEISGLYWHLVDVVWVFLYPALYLVR
ncbi:cytochrome c oxidase subunit 3 [Geminicoccaceae bacterium 1502E]|nr:cytochrome c oxidase subunit 3 [Geminicoccaceae bacterium 1502E]